MKLTEIAAQIPCQKLAVLVDNLKVGKEIKACGFAGSFSPFVASSLFKSTGRQLLYIAAKQSDLDRIESELEAFIGRESIFVFPAYDILPYERRKPQGRIVEERIRTLRALSTGSNVVVVAALQTLFYRLPPPDYIKRNVLTLNASDEIEMELVIEWLVEMGYSRVHMVDDVGQFSIRGGILDLFSFGLDKPVRLEFWGDSIESIRSFDIFSQRSTDTVSLVTILPMKEVVLPARGGEPQQDEVGSEWMVPGITGEEISLLDYMSTDALIFNNELPSFSISYNDTKSLLLTAERKSDDYSPEKLLVGIDRFTEKHSTFARLTVNQFKADGVLDFNTTSQPIYSRAGTGYFDEFKFLTEKGFVITVACENEGQAKRFSDLTKEAGVDIAVVVGALEEGFLLNDEKYALFSENRLLNRYQGRTRFRKYKGGTTLHHISSLKAGDIVVHSDHGIGKFICLERIKVGRIEKDCIRIEYRDKAILSVPVEDLNKVQKYSVSDDGITPELTPLGGRVWERTKSKAREELNKIVSGLVQVYAQRQFDRGYSYDDNTSLLKEFEDAFIYEETPDQRKATDEIIADLFRKRPMDRLLCGDAGFGKTEVAMRAAFKVIEAGYQVALLVPTTLLALQHYQSFSERFRDFPARIDLISRFSSTKEAVSKIKNALDGNVDILIGTHRLLSKDIDFKKLGLLIIDEEHKFGVRHKEKLKALKARVDVLSMTATPIPRTLQFSLLGVRDMSLISTPPLNRLPVHTRIIEEDRTTIRETIIRERTRGGQLFFLHNKVQTIDTAADEIRELVPGLVVGVAHGQMHEDQMESVVFDFINKKIDLLVTSTIIESGVDIPNANTIIIRNADCFGLSQLYQLRGRVGRSSIQGYALLMVSSFARLTKEAQARLKAMEQLTEFGSGFQVAMRDLEIRGAGNMLGTRQHGLMCQVGFEMYSELLNEAVVEVKENKKVTKTDPFVRMDSKAYIPAEYIEETGQRLAIYHRLSRAKSLSEIDDMKEELKDRYGVPPEEVVSLINVIAIKFIASKIQSTGVSVKKGSVSLEFSSAVPLDTSALAAILSRLPKNTTIRYEKPLALDIPTAFGVDELFAAREAIKVLA